MIRLVSTVVLLAVAAACTGDDPAPVSPISHRLAYGADQDQFAILSRPDTDEQLPVVVMIHGGFWRDRYRLDLMLPLVEDLVAAGYAVWNIEYRRVGESGGGWPTTLDDVAAAVDALGDQASEHRLHLGRVAVVGHSAGGHLAAWVTGHQWTSGAAVKPVLAVAQAGVLDLLAGARDGVGETAIPDLLGGEPDEVPERYEAASPVFVDGVHYLSIHGADDEVVPPRYGELPDDVDGEQVVLESTDHFDVIEPTHESWTIVRAALDEHLRS